MFALKKTTLISSLASPGSLFPSPVKKSVCRKREVGRMQAASNPASKNSLRAQVGADKVAAQVAAAVVEES
jgi:hypothetical protein